MILKSFLKLIFQNIFKIKKIKIITLYKKEKKEKLNLNFKLKIFKAK